MSTEAEQAAAKEASDKAAKAEFDRAVAAQVALKVEEAIKAAKAGETDPGDGKEPVWLRGRLERATNKLLKDLGIENAEDAKAALADYRAKVEAGKSELLKVSERAAALPALQQKVLDLNGVLGSYASAEMAKLDAAKQAAVKAIAGDDSAAQLKAISALGPTWVVVAPVVVAPTAAEIAAKEAATAEAAKVEAARVAAEAAKAKRPIPPLAGSAPPPGAPSGMPPSTVDKVKLLEVLDATNPVRAAAYYRENKAEIDALRAQATST